MYLLGLFIFNSHGVPTNQLLSSLKVTRPPLHGYLEIDPPPIITALNFNAVSVFDQSIINEERLHYIQSISNQSSDFFAFEVSNGISRLNDLVFHVTILPKNLYIETRDLLVTEGKEASLTLANIHVITDYFVDKFAKLSSKF